MASDTGHIVRRAAGLGIAVPGFNIPYLPIMEPVVRALRTTDSFGLVMVARLEWVKFASESPERIAEVYASVEDPDHTRLHLDHIPVIDEDDRAVDYREVIKRALAAGYRSVMVDGSRLPLEENIRCTSRVVEMAHAVDVPVEAELGAVFGHESGPAPSYEDLFESGRGFTDPDQARQFVTQSGVDWLSVAIGNVHGAIAAGRRDKQKPRARLNLERLAEIRKATGIPLVLHGGTGIPSSLVREAIGLGIAKINIATAIRQPYEAALAQSPEKAREAVYRATCEVLENDLAVAGRAADLLRQTD